MSLRRRLSPCILASALAVCAPSHAGTLTVLNTSDSGAGSLREKVGLAGDGDTIVFDSSIAGGTITLTSGELPISLVVTVDGTGSNVTVSGGNASRVFRTASDSATLKGLTIRDGNAGAGGGGGIWVQTGLLMVQGCTITENRTTGSGGGVLASGDVQIVSSTLSGNVAASGGGASIAGTGTVTNTTLSGNVATASGGGLECGGTCNVSFSTIAYNHAGASGGGVIGGSYTASLLGRNLAPSGPDCSGTVNSGGYNLATSISGCTVTGTVVGSIVGQDPLLGSLEVNVEGTPTHALRPGSPAMDTVPIPLCLGLVTTDARGVARGQGGGTAYVQCDMGAYEARTPIVVNSLKDPSDAGLCTLHDAIAAANTNAAVNGCAAGSAGEDRIVFGVSGRISLHAGLAATESVMLDGPGPRAVIVSGRGLEPVLDFQSGSGANGYVLAGVGVADGLAGVRLSGGADDGLAVDRVSFVDDAVALSFVGRRGEVSTSTFSNGVTDSDGTDSLICFDTPCSATNVTFDGNFPDGYAAAVLSSLRPARLRLTNCTVRTSTGFSTAPGLGAGTAVIELRGSVVDGPTPLFVGGGAVVSKGDNVFARAPMIGSLATGDVSGVDPKMGPALWNGGPVKTMAPDVGSPAIDRIPLERCAALTDARGVVRPIDTSRGGGTSCDAGAFEAPPPIVVDSLADGSAVLGHCVLRDALAAADLNTPQGGCLPGIAQAPDRITFAVTGKIVLDSALQLPPDVAILGPGADKLTISGNNAAHVLYATGGGAVTLSGVTVAEGNADAGAGLYASVDTLSIDRCRFRDNVATATADHIESFLTPTVQILRSTFERGSTGGTGQALRIWSAEAELEESTISDSGGSVGLELIAVGSPSHTRLRFSTIAGTDGVGVEADSQGGSTPADNQVDYVGTIVSGHGANFSLAGGTGTSLGYNLVSDGTGNLTGSGDKPGTNPLLGVLAYNGGPTPTFNLLPASPAKDAGICTGSDHDQRGFARPVGLSCDIGAVERVASGDANGNGVLDVADVFYLINFLFAGGPVPIGECDANGDGTIGVADVFYIINALFAGGSGPV